MDFNKVEDAYAFFRTHTDQTDRTIEALRAHLPEPPPRSVLDFGCGECSLLAGLCEGWTPALVLLVDPADTRLQAEDRMRRRGVARVHSAPDLAGLPEERVTLALANQVLFYVEDLRATLQALWDRLEPGGRLLISQAGSEKATTVLRDRFFAGQGLANPYVRAEDVERELGELGLAFERSVFESTLSFPDTPENCRAFLRFLLGKQGEEQCALLDEFRVENRVTLHNVDHLLRVDRA